METGKRTRLAVILIRTRIMAEQKKQNESRKNQETPQEAGKCSQDILERVHGYVQFGKRIEGNDRHWEGIINVNKDVTVTITDTEVFPQRPVKIFFPAGVDQKCGFSVLQQLILRATKEGPVDKRHDWNATGEPRTKNPLKIEIKTEGISSASPASYQQNLRIPTP